MSSVSTERWPVPVPLIEANIVAPPVPVCPRPSAWPISWQATPCRSMPEVTEPGPSCQVQLL